MGQKNKETFVKKTCPKCGSKFVCGANVGKCWCQSYRLSANSLEKLKENYSNCLCPDCLAAFCEKNDGTTCGE